MIEWKPSRSGDFVPCFNGVWLGSSVDPKKEARTWASQHQSLVRGVRSAIVLGIGGGYHLEALSAGHPELRVLGLDHNSELRNQVEARLRTQNRKLEVANFLTLDEALEDAKWKEALGHSYVVLRHPPSQRLNPEFFGHWERTLRGRDPVSFRHLAELRGLSMTVLPNFDDQRSPLSITDVYSGMSRSPVTPEGRMIWEVLKELIR